MRNRCYQLDRCMQHTYNLNMHDTRTLNLLGALALALSDDIHTATATRLGHGAAAPAALVLVGNNPGHSIEFLSHALFLSHSGTVRLVDRLVQAGLLERRAGSDGRSVALHLTASGEAAVHAMLQAREQVLAAALAGFSDVQQAQLTVLLEQALSNLARSPQHADHICRLCDEAACPLAGCPTGAQYHTGTEPI